MDRLEGRQDLHVQPRAQHPLARRPSVSSADVKFTYDEILLKLHPRTRTLTDVIERISAPSKNVVVFRLKQRYAPFLTWLDEDNGAILPRHLYRGTDPLTNPVNLRPVGTGPFKFESYSPGDRVVLVRNPTYFKEGLRASTGSCSGTCNPRRPRRHSRRAKSTSTCSRAARTRSGS